MVMDNDNFSLGLGEDPELLADERTREGGGGRGGRGPKDPRGDALSRFEPRQGIDFFGREPVFTTEDRYDYVPMELRRTPTWEGFVRAIAPRRKTNLDQGLPRFFREVEVDDEAAEKLGFDFMYYPVDIINHLDFYEPGDRSPVRHQIVKYKTKEPVTDPDTGEVVKDESGEIKTKTVEKIELVTFEPPDLEPGFARVWRRNKLYTPDGYTTNRNSRMPTGFGLIPRDETDQLFKTLLEAEGLDKYYGKPPYEVPPDAQWRIRQLRVEARQTTMFGPRVDPADPDSPRDWRQGYVLFERIYHRFRQWVREKKAEGRNASWIRKQFNISKEFYQFTYSEWGAFWNLINEIAQQASQSSPDFGDQDPQSSVDAAEAIHDLFSFRPAVRISKVRSAMVTKKEGENEEVGPAELIYAKLHRTERRSVYATIYDLDSLRKWIEGNNFALQLYQNADEGRLGPNTSGQGRDSWYGGAFSNQPLYDLVPLGVNLDIRITLGPPLASDLLGRDLATNEFVGPDQVPESRKLINLRPATQLWSDKTNLLSKHNKSVQTLQSLAQSLSSGDQLTFRDVEGKYSHDLIYWQEEMVWVYTGNDPDEHPEDFINPATRWSKWLSFPAPWREVQMVFPWGDRSAWLDLGGASRSDQFNWTRWKTLLQEAMTRAGITDDIITIDDRVAFDHMTIAYALWLYQSVENFHHSVERPVTEARMNRITEYLEIIQKLTEGLPGAEVGRDDMEEVIWEFRREETEWFIRRVAENYFYGWARNYNLSGSLAKGRPWRLGDDEYSYKLWGELGLHNLVVKVGDSFAGLGEFRDDPDNRINVPGTITDWRLSGYKSRSMTWFFWYDESPPGDGNTHFYRRREVMRWIEVWASVPRGRLEHVRRRPVGKLAKLAERVMKEGDWGKIEADLIKEGLQSWQIRRIWYAYAPIHGMRLD